MIKCVYIMNKFLYSARTKNNQIYIFIQKERIVLFLLFKKWQRWICEVELNLLVIWQTHFNMCLMQQIILHFLYLLYVFVLFLLITQLVVARQSRSEKSLFL